VNWGDLRPGPVQIVMNLFEKWTRSSKVGCVAGPELAGAAEFLESYARALEDIQARVQSIRGRFELSIWCNVGAVTQIFSCSIRWDGALRAVPQTQRATGEVDHGVQMRFLRFCLRPR
jgi:hypothetical protein